MSEEKQTLVRYMISEIEERMRESDFQRDFFESLCDQFHKRNSLSEKQVAAMQKIYERVTK